MFPQIFKIGDFFIPTYGMLVSSAFLLALWVTGRLAARDGLSKDSVLNLGIYCALAGIAGARILLLILDLPYYLANPGEIFSLGTLRAGGVFYGGLIAALLVAWWYMRRTKLPLLRTADVFAPGLAIGHAVGRIGCFSAGCCWGIPTHLPWAVTFTNPEANRLVGVPLGIPMHPTQLYEAFAEAVIFTVLYRRIRKPHVPGTIISLYLVLYSTARFLVEFLRVHDQPNPFGGPLNTSQWLSLVLFALGAAFLAKSRKPETVLAVK
jgi:phosphatidylglycerol:prolipoprotein diacylglycerol transferase